MKIQKMTPKSWAIIAGASLMWQCLTILTWYILFKSGRASIHTWDWLFIINIPAIPGILYHSLSVYFGVIFGKYGDNRIMKILAIHIFGPIVLLYLAWNYKKYRT